MSDEPQIEMLQEANQQLQQSLKACHELVTEYRARLTANGNEPLFFNERGGDSEAARS